MIFLDELRRLDIDDVKNSEYIEETDIRRYDQIKKSFMMSDPSVIADDETKSQLLYKDSKSNASMDEGVKSYYK